MPKPDDAHRKTDKELAELERRIAKIYADAAKEMEEKVKAYFEYFAKRDADMKAMLEAGEITEQEYIQWRLAQIGRGQRFEAMRDELAERMTKANEIVAAYINDKTPGIYSLNHNYAAYTIEKIAGDMGFALLDEQTVKRLLVEHPDLLPSYPKDRAVDRGIDLKWGKQQITAEVTSGILQGESIKHIADRLSDTVFGKDRNGAIRAARTAVTSAQNAGRIDSYKAAKAMGIKLKKEWLATLDNRTRHEHAELDGQTAEVDEPFKVGKYKLMYPGDPDGAPEMIYNCRCTLVAALDDVDTSDAKRWSRDSDTGKSEIVNHMTYTEWAKRKDTSKSIQSGGQTGAKKTEGWETQHAERFYEEVRNRAPYSDARNIVKYVEGFSVQDIEDIRQHVFITLQPRNGTLARFDADYDQAQVWQRLIEGKDIRPSDIIFLKHELYELTLMREKGYNYEKAHDLANELYNWFEAAKNEEN